jgi:LacI family transcriptional regulator
MSPIAARAMGRTTVTEPRRRVTQKDIARMAGVSQTTVSFVLNDRTDPGLKIAPETRERVRRAIAETGYIADPIARRLAARRNRILGVFTYEPVFPSANSDFYHPFLVGIEQRAEDLDCNLLLLTSARAVDGRRRIFWPHNRMRLADGCIVLGRSLDREELHRLVADGLPFVSIGRRDDAGGPVPYVGADYAAATAEIVRAGLDLGHRSLAYLGHGEGPEAWTDRYRGFREGVAGRDVAAVRLPIEAPAAALTAVLDDGVTAVFAEEAADGAALWELARHRGVDLSVVTLGEPTRAAQPMTVPFSGIRVPRERMGGEAVDVLAALVEGAPVDSQRLLPCVIEAGATLRPPSR